MNRRTRGSLTPLFVVCGLLVAVAGLLQVGFGAFGMGVGSAWRALVSPEVWGHPGRLWAVVSGGDPGGAVDTETLIVWTIRLPRVCAAVLVGAALGVSGAVFQGVTRNELASPYILGVSAGAGLTALTVLVFAAWLTPVLPLFAALGGGLAFLTVYAIAWRNGTSPVRLVLAGVVVAMILTSLQTALYLFADNVETVHNAVAWTTGSLVGVDWDPVRRAVVWIGAGLTVLLLASRQLDVMALGDRTASSVGMRIERTRFLLATMAVVLASSSVTVAGTVGFVGLIVPHMARSYAGSVHRRLLPASAALGAALLTVADTAARLAFNPVQVPVGIVTGLAGGGYFLVLMRRRAVRSVDGEADDSETPLDAGMAPAADPRGGERDPCGLSVRSLELGYPEGPSVVTGASFTALPGELTVLVGPNGSGKSTLFRGIARQLIPRAGTVTLSGTPLHTLPRRDFARLVAIMRQEHDVPPDLTVAQLVMHGRHPYRSLFRAPTAEDRKAVDRAMERAGIAAQRDRSVRELSGGQRQLAWLALGLAQETRVVLLDEPTTFLDLSHQFQLLERVADLARSHHIAVVAVLHDLTLAHRFADHLVVLKRGRVRCAGAPGAVLSREVLAEVFEVEGRVGENGLEIAGPLTSDGSTKGAGAHAAE